MSTSPKYGAVAPSSSSGLRCLGVLACVAFALFVAAAIVVGVDGASVGVIIALVLAAFILLLLAVCLCCWLPSTERAGQAYNR